jgi:hypothetical protein
MAEPFQRERLRGYRLLRREVGRIFSLLARRQQQMAVEGHPRLDATRTPGVGSEAISKIWKASQPYATGQVRQPFALQLVGRRQPLIDAMHENDLSHLAVDRLSSGAAIVNSNPGPRQWRERLSPPGNACGPWITGHELRPDTHRSTRRQRLKQARRHHRPPAISPELAN